MRKITDKIAAEFRIKQTKMAKIHKTHNELIGELENELRQIVSRFNDENNIQIDKMKIEYSDLAESLKTLSINQTTKIDDYIQDRSDKWHDSDAGENYAVWLSDWNCMEEEFERACLEDFWVEIEIERLADLPSLPSFNP